MGAVALSTMLVISPSAPLPEWQGFHTYSTDEEAEPPHSATETLAFGKEALNPKHCC